MADLTTITTPDGHEDVIRALLTFAGNVRPSSLRGNDRGVTLTGDVTFDGDTAMSFNGFNSVNATNDTMRARRSGGNGFVRWRALSRENSRAVWRIAQDDNAVIVCSTGGTIQDGRWDLSAPGMVAVGRSGGTMAVLLSRPMAQATERTVSGSATRGTPTAAGTITREAVAPKLVSGGATRGTPAATGSITRETVAPKTVSGLATRGAPRATGIVRSETPTDNVRTIAGTARRGVPTVAGAISKDAVIDRVVSGTATRGAPVATGAIVSQQVAPRTIGGTATRGAPVAVGIINKPDVVSRSVSGAAMRGVPVASGAIVAVATVEKFVSGTATRGIPLATGRVTALPPIIVPGDVILFSVDAGVYSIAAGDGNYSVAVDKARYVG